MQVADPAARNWYEKEAYEQTWSVHTLQRNINTQYYCRMLQSQRKELVEQEMIEKTSDFQNDKLKFIKNPVIAEFLGFSFILASVMICRGYRPYIPASANESGKSFRSRV